VGRPNIEAPLCRMGAQAMFDRQNDDIGARRDQE
jgi:hypothetical protein